MSKSDFFGFCTTLKPVELKAIGELSHVEHIEEGVTIYSSGDPSDSLYIINRGAVAVIHEDPRYADRADISYLSRGDMFGEIDVLTDSYRRNAIRTCEPVSLQCFRREDFPEIIRRVPSFFYFIAQRLATRFVQVTDMAFVQSHCLELSGSLENFDLVTIYQTIVNSNQTGELAVYNTLGEAVAVFFFLKGHPLHAQYYHLHGEEALFQLFLHERIEGTFSFSKMEQPSGDETNSPQISRNPTDLLFSALQFRDEFRELARRIVDPTAILRPLKPEVERPEENSEDRELEPLAGQIFLLVQQGAYSVDDLFQLLQVCEHKLYKTILYLAETGHLELQTQIAATA